MRIARLINIIFYLLQKPIVSATELAERFEVSTRTIYRDVETLSAANIPIYTIQGSKGGIGLLPNYKIDKKFLTEEELRHLHLALMSIKNLVDRPEINDTLLKLQAMYDFSNYVEQITVQYTDWTGAIELKQLAQKLLVAVRCHQYVLFSYIDQAGNKSTRKVEPYRLAYKGERWYLQAFSLERNDFRTFRLSRMKDLIFSDETFSPRELPLEQLSLSKLPPTDVPVSNVTLQGSVLVKDLFVERFGYHRIHMVDEELFEATVSLPETENAYRFILSLGNKIKIIDGASFLSRFKEYLDSLTSLYSDPSV